jgi:predicted regulator of Ras-like GTPase activity (Roadblock/LC7/MglB family)
MFKETLQRLIDRTEGATGALIMGTDGIAVEKVLLEEARAANLDVAAAEFTSLLRGARRVGEDTGIGAVQELIVGFEDMRVLIRAFNRDYFAVLALREDGNLGRARFELRKVELDLAREFAL